MATLGKTLPKAGSRTKVAPPPLPTLVDEKARRYGRILLRAIDNELGRSPHFTREDLLHLSSFQHVSTISRYQNVCVAVHYLLESGAIKAMSRTDLVIASRVSEYRNNEPLTDQYITTIRRVVKRQKIGTTVTVMDLVHEWKTDPHLTVNLKRIAVRGAIKTLIKDGALSKKDDDFEYAVGALA